MKESFAEYRELFPVTRNWIYFNHAATAPYSSLTAGAMYSYIKDMESNGGKNYENWEKLREETRVLAGKLINCGPDEIALVSNTSEGANIVAQGLLWKPGDNIVIPDREFPANHYPWTNLQRKGVEIRTVPLKQGRVSVDDIMERVDAGTRLAAVSSVAYHNGFRMDIEKLGNRLHEAGVLFYVDAIQSLGMIPMDVSMCRISFLSADGHKWLLGPEGAAIFYCSRECLDRIEPAYVSWLSMEDPSAFDELSFNLAQGARRFECGTPNFAGCAGLARSLEMLLDAGISGIKEKVLFLTGLAEEGLRGKGYRLLSPREKLERSGILTFSHSAHSPEHVTDRLSAAKVVTTIRGGGVRISPHFYNSEGEVECFLKALP